MKFRYKAFLRNTSNISATGRLMINLPKDIWEEAEWKINDNLKIDVIKSGMNHSISITKEDTDGDNR
jgi:hypothetical protein